MKNKPQTKTSDAGQSAGLAIGKLVHVAIPVRWSPVAQQGKGPVETACTYDIHPHGARLVGSREMKVGDLILLERGRNKSVCRVVWAGDPGSILKGQFTVQCVDEGKTPWDDELRQAEEQYNPVIDKGVLSSRTSQLRRGDENRRRRPRYSVEGKADVSDGRQQLEAEVLQISECGARIATKDLLLPGTDFRLLLNVFDVSVALKAQVKYLHQNRAMGVEFQEIRRGDRGLFNYMLSRLVNTPAEVEDFMKVDVITDNGVAVAG
ncbi:MAG TPA: PilZ domain-containing protein [Candidatus Sulfotelmatobacter sp.]